MTNNFLGCMYSLWDFHKEASRLFVVKDYILAQTNSKQTYHLH